MKLIPLTSQQQDIYYESLLHPGAPIHNIGARIEIRGPLQLPALQQAYVALINQHDSFRGAVVTSGKAPQFRIADAWRTPLEWLDLSAEPAPEAAAHNFMQAAFVKPFDLETAEHLHYFCLIRVAADFHFLFSVYHHIITDGWGTSLMFQRLVSNYNDIVTTGAITASYPFYYEDYVAEDKAYHSSTAFTADRAYWQEQFRTVPDPVIPCLDNTPFTAVSGREELTVKRAVYNRLNELAASYQVSAFHILLGVLSVYLSRCYHSLDLVIGLPVLNRDKAVHKKTVGLFMGISPLRISLDPEENFAALVQRIRRQLRQDYRHQRFPLGRLLQEVGMIQEKHRLYNISVSYEKHHYAEAFRDTVTRVIPLTHSAEQAALAVYVREFSQDEDVKIDFDYNLHYFDVVGMQRFTGHFHTLLETVLEAAPLPLKTLSFLRPEETNMLLKAFNPAPAPDVAATLLLSLIARQAERIPEKTAIWDDVCSYSYTSLTAMVTQMAHALAALPGATAGKPIAVMMERTARLPVLLLGILKAGRPFIPLDPSFPAARLQYILDNSHADILIADAVYSSWQKEGMRLLTYEDLMAQTAEASRDIVLPLPAPEDTAYIIYTSGSTGNPKGVAISHRSLANFLVSMRECPGLQEQDLLFSVTSPSFDISMLEFFLPLITGATVYVADKHTLADPWKTIVKLQQVQPTILQATPGFYQLLFNAGWEGAAGLVILCGGDLLSTTLTAKLLQQAVAVWNMYGPTETTVWSAVKQIRRPEDSSNVGQPIHNTVIYILDEHLQPLPVGISGDIYIGGAGVAQGYYHNEPLTRQKFIINPFDNHQRIYHTGDIGRWTAAGEILFGGRSDTQVKVRGYRIELEEIEQCITRLPGMNEAVVVARKREGQDAFLIGFVKTDNPDFVPETVITALQARLPDYMVPQLIVPLAAFPLTPNQKIDRRSLAAWDIATVQPTVAAVPPQKPLERLLAALWEKILSISVDDRYANFFRLGGHSIKAVELATSISEQFGVSLGLKDIFEQPTIAGQAALLTAQRYVPQEEILRTAPQVQDDAAPVQRMMWLACQRPVISAAYNMHAIFSITGDFRVAAMEQAIQLLIRRHEILRTCFIEVAGIPRLQLHTGDAFRFAIQEVEIALPEELDTFLQDITATPFDLETELLLKAFRVRVGDGRQLFVFVTHHLILDGWSLEILVREALAAYRQLPDIHSLAPLSLQYRDYAAWSNHQLQAPAAVLHAAYWQEVLKDFTPLPAFKRAGSEPSFYGRRIYTCLKPPVRDALYTLAADREMSVFIVLLAAVHTLIARVGQQYDYCTGIPVAGREHPQLQELLGMLVNTVLVRGQLTATDTFEMVCEHIRDQFLQGIGHQAFPLEAIMNGREKADTMLFDVMVTWQHPAFSLDALTVTSDLTLTRQRLTQGGIRIPLTFNFYEEGTQLVVETEYDSGLYEEGQMLLLTARFKKLLEEMAHQPKTAIGSLDIALDMEKTLRQNSFEIEFEF
ncbi:non-ribosomal peptide synthetase [Chitinophaga flava]|uniref:Non-ribosomal peptide synthetase n=1 Tax=Chitinophaga flava TaxID=2259036 RepID=A0A365XQ61_9BACT|nr:non-ribosomal peptide synthetase [Chitinophaga flava]RBL88151.1 non-ribosomal peptide synthetase [Chitinophaga flava]